MQSRKSLSTCLWIVCITLLSTGHSWAQKTCEDCDPEAEPVINLGDPNGCKEIFPGYLNCFMPVFLFTERHDLPVASYAEPKFNEAGRALSCGQMEAYRAGDDFFPTHWFKLGGGQNGTLKIESRAQFDHEIRVFYRYLWEFPVRWYEGFGSYGRACADTGESIQFCMDPEEEYVVALAPNTDFGGEVRKDNGQYQIEIGLTEECCRGELNYDWTAQPANYFCEYGYNRQAFTHNRTGESWEAPITWSVAPGAFLNFHASVFNTPWDPETIPPALIPDLLLALQAPVPARQKSEDKTPEQARQIVRDALRNNKVVLIGENHTNRAHDAFEQTLIGFPGVHYVIAFEYPDFLQPVLDAFYPLLVDRDGFPFQPAINDFRRALITTLNTRFPPPAGLTRDFIDLIVRARQGDRIAGRRYEVRFIDGSTPQQTEDQRNRHMANHLNTIQARFDRPGVLLFVGGGHVASHHAAFIIPGGFQLNRSVIGQKIPHYLTGDKLKILLDDPAIGTDAPLLDRRSVDYVVKPLP